MGRKARQPRTPKTGSRVAKALMNPKRVRSLWSAGSRSIISCCIGGTFTGDRFCMFSVRIIKTGGTIAKSYDEFDGSLRINRPVIERLLSELRLPDVDISAESLLSKDSLDLTDDDRRLIVDAVGVAAKACDAVIVVHGTDTLTQTGELIHQAMPAPPVPIVLTGAMRPYEFRDSDALQNVTEALLASRLIEPGVYVAMHNRVLAFPGVVKDREKLSFVRIDEQRAKPSRARSRGTGPAST